MSSKHVSDSLERLTTLRKLLLDGRFSTQEEFVDELRKQHLEVTQSTVSRDLRRLGAVKTRDMGGRIVYRLPDDFIPPVVLPPSDLKGLVVSIQHNGSMIVIQTTPGSASLLARQLDQIKPAGILGTIAGDDTIFVAPSSPRKIEQTIRAIVEQFSIDTGFAPRLA